MAVLVYNDRARADEAHATVIAFVKVAPNLGQPEKWKPVEEGPDGRFYLVAPDLGFNPNALNPDDRVEQLPSKARDRALSMTISQARRAGSELIDGFMKSALEGNVNEVPGLAGQITRTLGQIILDCQIGSLYGARDNIDHLIATIPETEREGLPFTSDAALGQIRAQLSAILGEG